MSDNSQAPIVIYQEADQDVGLISRRRIRRCGATIPRPVRWRLPGLPTERQAEPDEKSNVQNMHIA
ncbi:hypothetical protein HALO32_02425 [Halomonas lysinitropha]|uniref:Uncharacterized protein n=1 Tax=Halomonas lysinitropha TaxID=2607506 RepID=A0A5K1IBW7_9GAMM|nr:hypothetical protein HALO32_02425 [Halomonas lysinitropha]